MNVIDNKDYKKIFIISSHMNRMIITIFEILTLMGQKIPEINFVLDNCTILKINKEGDIVKILMLYPIVNSNPARFRSIEYINELELSFKMTDFPSDLIIYLVRHGEGKHNVLDATMEDSYDAELTPKGKSQIIEASIAIKNDIEKDNETSENKNYKIFLGCSHLKRTWQTVYNIYNNFPIELKEKVYEQIYIIPGIQEMIRQIYTPQHYEKDSPYKRVALNPFYKESEYREKYEGKLTKLGLTDEELKKIVLENKPKNNIYDGIHETYYQDEGKVILLNWNFYLNTHKSKGITYEDCANETVIEAICNFYTFLLDNQLFN
jgi:bisphosphoglycerate-dependent phosphoglycerate mutase